LTPSEQQLLLDACSVVAALGPDTKKEVLSKFAQKQMDNYLYFEFKDGSEVRVLIVGHWRAFIDTLHSKPS
jgi:hypothetical protein